MVDQDPVLVAHAFNDQGLAICRRDLISRFEQESRKRRPICRVNALFLNSWKMQRDASIIGVGDDTQAERRIGVADPSLAG